ncbi:MAG: hypothetical protein Q8P07_01580 [bacterium]|nr:hypothetical protein [bacterium]
MKTPEWEIGKEEFLARLDWMESDFTRMLYLPDFSDTQTIIPLRFMSNVNALVPIRNDMLRHIISRVKTMNGHSPFENADIKCTKAVPENLKIGQKFAYRENLIGIIDIKKYFKQLAMPAGISELGAWFLYGTDENGRPALSCYMPPMIERHGKNTVIMDGIHRNYIAMSFGISMSVIHIENISSPFPCGMMDWSELQSIPLSEKPSDINERYFTLTKELFRDLKFLGIDG